MAEAALAMLVRAHVPGDTGEPPETAQTPIEDGPLHAVLPEIQNSTADDPALMVWLRMI